MAQSNTQSEMSEQYILNAAYERALKALVVLGAGYDGVNSQLPIGESMATKITVSGDITYIGIAAPGTAQGTAKWQCKKVDSSSGVVITWADGNADFDNTASDLTALTYS